MPFLAEVKRATYSRQRQASAGAAITLVCGCGEYVALFECATRISKVLGDRELEDLGDGLLEVIPRYRIPFAEMAAGLAKLTEQYSVALVDLICETEGPRFVLIWRIDCSKAVVVEAELTLDDI